MDKEKKILLSIGSVTAKEAIGYIEQGFIVYAYDPRKEVFQDYLSVQELYKDIYPFELAVSDFNGRAELSYSYNGAATINLPGKIKPNSYSVQVVSMESVLKQFERIDFLLINCEGAEIPIILNTDLSLFEKCDRIDVSFHRFVPYLKITPRQVQQCLNKMCASFSCTLVKPKHPFFSFINKRN